MKVKMFENYYSEKEFTADDMEQAMVLICEWLLDSMANGPDMMGEDKAKEIIEQVRRNKGTVSLGGFKSPWKSIDLSTKGTSWTSTISKRR